MVWVLGFALFIYLFFYVDKRLGVFIKVCIFLFLFFFLDNWVGAESESFKSTVRLRINLYVAAHP